MILLGHVSLLEANPSPAGAGCMWKAGGGWGQPKSWSGPSEMRLWGTTRATSSNMLGARSLLAALEESDGARAGVWSTAMSSGPAAGGFCSLQVCALGTLPAVGGSGHTKAHPCPAVATVCPVGDMGHAEVLAWAPPSCHLLLLGKGFVHGRTLKQLCVGIGVIGGFWGRGLPGREVGVCSGTFSCVSLLPG